MFKKGLNSIIQPLGMYYADGQFRKKEEKEVPQKQLEEIFKKAQNFIEENMTEKRTSLDEDIKIFPSRRIHTALFYQALRDLFPSQASLFCKSLQDLLCEFFQHETSLENDELTLLNIKDYNSIVKLRAYLKKNASLKVVNFSFTPEFLKSYALRSIIDLMKEFPHIRLILSITTGSAIEDNVFGSIPHFEELALYLNNGWFHKENDQYLEKFAKSFVLVTSGIDVDRYCLKKIRFYSDEQESVPDTAFRILKKFQVLCRERCIEVEMSELPFNEAQKNDLIAQNSLQYPFMTRGEREVC